MNNKMSTIDKLVLDYYNIGIILQKFDSETQYAILKYIEQEYDTCADTEFGDFIDIMVQTYLYDIHDEDFHQIIREVIEHSEVNEDLLGVFSEHMYNLIC